MKLYSNVIAVLILVVFAASGSAMARGGHGGSGHGGGHFGGSVGFGIALGVPLYGLGYYSGYYPPYTYPAPDYIDQRQAMAPSSAYVEQGYAQAAPAPAPQQDWFFCPNSNAYYPLREGVSQWLAARSLAAATLIVADAVRLRDD